MKLSKLIQDSEIEIIQGNNNIEITGITINSKEVNPGDLFIAYEGFTTDSHKFIPEAIKNGASVICVEREIEDIPENIPVIKTKDVRKDMSILADNFYDHPSRKLTTIGITGTKGKTTTTEMIANVLSEAGYNVGTIGTLGIKYNDIILEPVNTTPDSLILHKTFKDMLDSGVDTVVMECSSQGLKLDRTYGINYDIGLLLNISPDHIGGNEHKDFEDYLNSKLKLVEQSKNLIVNCSDSIWNYLSPQDQNKAITFSKDDSNADYYATNFKPVKKVDLLGSEFDLNGDKNKKIELSILGEYNNLNALAAIATAEKLSVNFSDIKEGLKKTRVSGRSYLYPLASENGLTILTDFAHNKVSAFNLLNDLKAYHPEKIICGFGLEYDEAKLRRYDLGNVIGKLADSVILTTTSLGDLDFYEVNAEVIQGLKDSNAKFSVHPDRKVAYKEALDQMNKNDFLVLINLFGPHSGGIQIQDYETLDQLIVEKAKQLNQKI